MKARNDGEKSPPEEIDPYEDARMRGLCEEGAEEVAREAEKRDARSEKRVMTKRRSTVKIATLVFAAGLLAACGSAAPPESVLSRDGPVLHDTATANGVLVMHHSADAFERAPQWTLDPKPAVVSDHGDPQFDLTKVSQASLLQDGRVIAIDRIGGGRLMLFDAEGRPERILARSGQGPGELVRPDQPITLEGDTIVVLDGANRTVNWYTAADGYIRSAPLAGTVDPGCFPGSWQLTDGQFIGLGGCSSMSPPTEGASRDSIPVVSHTLDFSEFDTVLMVPGYELQAVETRRRGRSNVYGYPLRYGQYTTVTALDSRLVVASGVGGYVLELHNISGELVGKITVDRSRIPVTDVMRQVLIDRELAQINSPNGEGRVDANEDRRLAREVPFADSLPPYSRVYTGTGGLIWVVDPQTLVDTAWSATAFTTDGAIIARLTSSRPGGPVWFGRDRVIVRETDADDVVRFAVYRIRKT